MPLIMASAKCISGLIILATVFRCGLAITTTHHDKPEDTQPSIMASKMKQEETQSINTTLEASERQKRLLPYMTFYLEHDFNRPQNQIYSHNGQRYKVVQQKGEGSYPQFQTKFNDLIGVNLQNPPVTGGQKIKITPFLESNAIPGPFIPMRNPNLQPIKQTQPNRQHEPNYSAIYDKLSQLKLQQQQNQLAQSFNHYNQHYSQQNYKKPQAVNYIPVQEPEAYKPLKNAIIQTYSAATVDIPDQGESFEQIAVPVKTYIKNYPINLQSPHQDHVLPLTDEEQRQYLEDQKYNVESKKQKPILILRQKTRLVPQKIYQDDPKNYAPQGPKPIFILRKPVQKPQVAYEVLQEPIRYHPLKFHDTPKFVVSPKYQPIPIPVAVPHPAPPVKFESVVVETVTPKYVDIIEPKPTFIPVATKYEEQQKQQKYSGPKYIFVKHNDPKYEDTKYEEPKEEEPQYQNPKYVDVKYENPKFVEQKFLDPKYTNEDPNYVHPKYEKPYEYEDTKFIEPTRTYATKYVTAYPNYETVKYAPTAPTESPEVSVKPAPPTEDTNSLSLILKKLQDTNALPQTLTPDNIDNSIRTLVRILSSLKKKQNFSRPIVVPDESGEYEDDINNEAGVGLGGSVIPDSVSHFPGDTPEGGTPGKPGIDYPALSSIPQTSFNCKTQRYKGFFGDPDTHCQVWHYCDLNGGQASFLCPNGTIFSQVALTCDWWYNVKCSNTAQLYVLNERLYKYILPLSPKFPEDYSGPLVDRYLALKFQEMEEKMQKERKKNKENSSDEGEEETTDEIDDADELSKEEKRKNEHKTQSSESEMIAEN